MSKKKKSGRNRAPAAPEFQPSVIKYGDDVVGRTSKENGQITTQYLPSAAEQERKKFTNERINQILPQLGKNPQELTDAWNQQQDAYVDSAVSQFDRSYNPALRNMREDITSRFGTTNNSMFLDRLGEMESNVRVPFMEETARKGTLYRTDLENQHQAKQMNELQALGYNLNSDQQRFLSGLNAPLSSSAQANQFNQNNHLAQLNQYNTDRAHKQGNTNSFLSFLGSIF